MRLSSKSLFILLFSIISFSCTKSKSVDEFSTNQSLWKGKNIQNYTFTLRLICYCPPARTGPHVIKVVNGRIASVNGLPYDESKTGKLYPITEYFDFINTSLSPKPFRSEISYNPKYGYPEVVYFDFSEAIADDEIRYAITSFIVN
jgi:hypothetical protein